MQGVLTNPQLQIPDQARQMINSTILSWTNDAFVAGMNDAMLVGGLVLIVAAALVLVRLPARVCPPQGVTHEAEQLPAQGDVEAGVSSVPLVVHKPEVSQSVGRPSNTTAGRAENALKLELARSASRLNRGNELNGAP